MQARLGRETPINIMLSIIEVTTTVDSELKAIELATYLVESRLAACIQILGPITSVYRWEGKVQKGVEWKIVAKSTRDRLEPLQEAILSRHPYQTPELLVIECDHAHPKYASWVMECM